ncbi:MULTISPECIES: DUF6022 family protein [Bacillales]|uniref:DUF6022 family protein n=1 Tax=Bacillales TaxID=1385 RepID=UPI0006A7A666|nr:MULTISPECIES: DUF6022 family protein [Bacillales]OBZ17860.1 hypothetical protein A7975_00800 [Bacillus sp. FJAT-26390]
MNQAKPLKAYLEASHEGSIDAIASYVEEHVTENWQTVFSRNQDKLLRAYHEAGDMAYGTYLNLLFLPIHRQLKENGFRPEPHFPGEFDISREWGNEEENDQQRWMWSTVYSQSNERLGTIVTVVYHDHTQLRIPRQPRIIALTETGKDAVVAALSLLSSDFEQALEFTEEYAAYLRSQQD